MLSFKEGGHLIKVTKRLLHNEILNFHIVVTMHRFPLIPLNSAIPSSYNATFSSSIIF